MTGVPTDQPDAWLEHWGGDPSPTRPTWPPQPQSQAGYLPPAERSAPPPPAKRRVFWSLYAAAQIIFLALFIATYETASQNSIGSVHAARDIGIAIVGAVWCGFDIILASTFLVYRHARPYP